MISPEKSLILCIWEIFKRLWIEYGTVKHKMKEKVREMTIDYNKLAAKSQSHKGKKRIIITRRDAEKKMKIDTLKKPNNMI